jgi:hypothetical protein
LPSVLVTIDETRNARKLKLESTEISLDKHQESSSLSLLKSP